MIIKGRSPTTSHVSRTHRVALDWLFDRINLETKIQIKYVDTKNQFADMLTKESFTRDEWNHLSRLINIMSFSLSCSHCSNFLSDLMGKQSAMSKRGQEATSSEGVTDGETEANDSDEGDTPSTWCYAREARGTILRRIWGIRSIRWMSMKDKVVRLVQGDLYGPPKAQKSNVLNWGDRKRRLVRAAIPGQSFKSWSTQKIKTRRRSSISCKRSWGLQQDTQHFQWKHWRQMCCCGECSCLRQWKQPVHLGPNFFGEPGGSQEREFRGNSELGQYHTETDIRSILKKFWMWVRLKVPLFHGRDRRCLLIKWSSEQERKYVFTQIPYLVLRRCMMTEMQLQDGKVKWNSKCPLLTENS